MTPEKFIAKWKDSTLKERSASQSHFNDLCDLLGVEKPTDVDQKGGLVLLRARRIQDRRRRRLGGCMEAVTSRWR
jgi:hypothetical protein